MKNSVTKIKFINRLLMSITILLFVPGIVSDNWLMIALIATIILALFQLISSVFFIRFWRDFTNKIKIAFASYYGLVPLYFLMSYLMLNSFIVYFEEAIIIIPIMLALLISILIELSNKLSKE